MNITLKDMRAMQDALRGARFDPQAGTPHTGFRDRLLAGLRHAEGGYGWSLADVPLRAEPDLADQPPHALVVWMVDADMHIQLYAVPDTAIDDRQAAALASAGGTFAGPEDMEGRPREWGANVRVMAALGESGTAEEEFHELYVDGAWWGDEVAPTREEVQASWGTWRAHVVRTAADLDRRFTRVCVMHLAM